MSTVTAVKKNGKICIAADTLVKWGNEKNPAKYVVNHNKIVTYRDNYFAVTGPASGILTLKHYFESLKDPVKFTNVDEVFDAFLDIQSALKEDYHLEIKTEETGFEPNSMFILLANTHGIFAIGSYRDVQEFSSFYAYGSGSEYALGAMLRAYEDPNLSAEEVAKIGIAAAAEFDDGTDLPIIAHVIEDKSGAHQTA